MAAEGHSTSDTTVQRIEAVLEKYVKEYVQKHGKTPPDPALVAKAADAIYWREKLTESRPDEPEEDASTWLDAIAKAAEELEKLLVAHPVVVAKFLARGDMDDSSVCDPHLPVSSVQGPYDDLYDTLRELAADARYAKGKLPGPGRRSDSHVELVTAEVIDQFKALIGQSANAPYVRGLKAREQELLGEIFEILGIPDNAQAAVKKYYSPAKRKTKAIKFRRFPSN